MTDKEKLKALALTERRLVDEKDFSLFLMCASLTISEVSNTMELSIFGGVICQVSRNRASKLSSVRNLKLTVE